ncbi:MAG: excinuclease ABC subunit UvrC [Gammaproteobacteria bacterium]|nr:excinuclease ABC subunit UvrC [Gammaproteobacteria bacterium]
MDSPDPRELLQGLSSRPGVYRLLDGRGRVLYVGKAANLKKRVSSYFGRRQDSPKTQALVRQVRDVEVTVTRSEGEALLLESNLIKELKPRYNVVFRDDKSYPFLYLSIDPFPRLSFYRGTRKGKGRYFGPYPNAGAARRTLNLTQKLFRLRQCDDTFFRNRRRPCLQYQIRRCTAPCVGLIEADRYREDVRHAVLFLEGRDEDVISALTGPMQAAAETMDFERAALYRDQIAALRRIQEQQHVTVSRGDCDVVACAIRAAQACVQVFYIRGGRNLGNRTYFPSHGADETAERIIGAFLNQHYLSGPDAGRIPSELFLSHGPEDVPLLERVLSDRRGGPVHIQYRLRGEKARWMEMAKDNAAIALEQRLSAGDKYRHRLETLRVATRLDEVPERIECFDISHTRGEATVASCVVYGPDGPVKSDYRRFNISGVAPGDDYGAIRQVVERRYSRLQREDARLPDLILVDGGTGQLRVAQEVMRELQLEDIAMIAVAKGPARRPGLETLILSAGQLALRLEADSPGLHLIQEIRDEAHRFAVMGHRRARGKRRMKSPLEEIHGVGARRRQELLRYFGGLQGVERAGVEELARAPGIHKNLAQKIYTALHGE